MPWLMKTEPETYSIDDLARDGRTWWEGVRNYQARNFMRDAMRIGDPVLVYHSSAEPPGVAGLASVSAAAKPDLTALDPKDPHFDPKATKADPIWAMVEIAFVERFAEVIPLAALRAEAKLEGLALLARGQRLSIQPVSEAHFRTIVALAKRAGATRNASPRSRSVGR
jgi:predicted RNA-binding protein with PUA-like domain